MTCARIYTVYPDTTVDDALQLICQHRVSGLPVVDPEGKVVGIVSDYDLLNLEGILQEDKERGLFPPVDECWSTFKSIRTLLDKTGSKFVEDVMTRDPYTIKPHVHVDEAAKMLMTKCVRRLPVVDDDGRLVGVLSRGNIVRAVLKAHMAGKSVDQA